MSHQGVGNFPALTPDCSNNASAYASWPGAAASAPASRCPRPMPAPKRPHDEPAPHPRPGSGHRGSHRRRGRTRRRPGARTPLGGRAETPDAPLRPAGLVARRSGGAPHHRGDLRPALPTHPQQDLLHRHRDAVHGRRGRLLDVLPQPGVRLVRPALGVGDRHPRAAAVRAPAGPAAAVGPPAGTAAPHHQPQHHLPDRGPRPAVRGRTGPARHGVLELRGGHRLRGGLRPRRLRLGHRADRHAHRPGGPVSRDPARPALLRTPSHRPQDLAGPAPLRDRRLRPQRLAHPAVRDQCLVRRLVPHQCLAAPAPDRRAAAPAADAARPPFREAVRPARSDRRGPHRLGPAAGRPARGGGGLAALVAVVASGSDGGRSAPPEDTSSTHNHD